MTEINDGMTEINDGMTEINDGNMELRLRPQGVIFIIKRN
ncbi:hypothetical protein BMS3Abin08_02024 [bacterium BMS3Abin08]|nr:hypothetical protein BMS3Abin08_02024 [bacterium BMS3Abin08]